MKGKNSAKWRQIGAFTLTAVLCGLAFFLTSLGVLWQEGSAQTEKNQVSEPYFPPPPQSTPIMFLWEEGGGEIVYLDFEQNEIVVTILPQNCDENAALVYGYRDFEAIKANYLLIISLVDRLGGIEVEGSGEALRLTGAQIASFVGKSEDFTAKREVISAIFRKIAISGFSNNDFMFIINNSNTTLSFPDCYGWDERLAEMAKNTRNKK